ncbi:hypothetical protein PILCRDRAFT_36252, partial [Piloderma croceum F 1598]
TMTEGTSAVASASPGLRFVTANLNFFDTRLKKPNDFRWTAKAMQLERPSNTTTPDAHRVRIYDLRSLSSSQWSDAGFTLDRCGFEIMQGWSDEGDNVAKAWGERKWEVRDWIATEYCSYSTDHWSRLIKRKLKATSSVAWNYTLRKPTYASSKSQDAPALVGINQTHIDQTYWAAIERVRLHLGNDAAQKVLDGSARAVICNVWRPLIGPVSDLPLAIADFGSLDDQRDFRETLPAPPGCRTGESQMLRFHPDQKWYYLSGMQPHECLLLKCFDSLTGVRSPHS